MFDSGTKVEIRSIDGTEYMGTVVKDNENKFPDYILLNNV